jgi:hypothetical protein
MGAARLQWQVHTKSCTPVLISNMSYENIVILSYHSVSFGHCISQLSGHAKIGQLGVALHVQENVASLYVSMDFLSQV